MNEKLKECPFCSCHMRIFAIGRDWYRLTGNHNDNCILNDQEIDVSQDEEQRLLLIKDWNTRHIPTNETVEKYLPCCATCKKWADSVRSMHCTSNGNQVLRDDWCFDYVSIDLPKHTGTDDKP